jgi:hypothetical protein
MRSPESNDIVYFRARVCGSETFDLCGKECVLVEPVDKHGNSMPRGGWVFSMPIEWLIPVEEMRAKIRRARDVQGAD